MCLIIVKPQGKEFPIEQIKNAWYRNSDGAGIAVLDGKQAHVTKGFFDLDELLDFLAGLEASSCVVIHLRYATHGLVDSSRCHPFPLTDNAKYIELTEYTYNKILFHNGVINIPTQGSHSDTQEFILGTYPNTREWCTVETGSRFCYFDNGKLSLIGNWHCIDGIWYSNKYSLEKPMFRDTFEVFENSYDKIEEIEKDNEFNWFEGYFKDNKKDEIWDCYENFKNWE